MVILVYPNADGGSRFFLLPPLVYETGKQKSEYSHTNQAQRLIHIYALRCLALLFQGAFAVYLWLPLIKNFWATVIWRR